MRILIDGYNLIRRIPELARADRRDLQEGREALLAALASYRSARGHAVTVVFDGASGPPGGRRTEAVRGVSVLFSPPGRSADEILARLCREGRADLLVTADREVAATASSRGLTVAAPEAFWDRVEEERMRRLKGDDGGRDAEEAPQRDPGRKPSRRRRQDLGRLERL